MACIHAPVSEEVGHEPRSKLMSEFAQEKRMCKLLCAADLPFSFVGDVVTWPYTASYTFINEPVPVPPVIQAPPLATLPLAKVPTKVMPETLPVPVLPKPKELP